MKTITLHGKRAQGRVALVDDEDYDLVRQYRWHIVIVPQRSQQLAYAGTKVNGSRVLMHRMLTGWFRTDHEDHDGLNNQRSNLRPVTAAQNSANRRPNANSKWSRYKGVSWDAQKSRWIARIQGNGNKRKLGTFTAEEDAARAYNAAALEAYGPYACLNDIP